MIRIVTDSSADISARLASELDITVVPLRVRVGRQMLRDGIDIDLSTFYRHMSEGVLSPTVEAPPHTEFHDVYSQLLEGADQILSIHSSSSLNGSVLAAQEATRAFLGRSKITVVDSRMISWGLALLAILAAQSAQRGDPADEIVRLIRGTIPHIYMVFFTENLEYFGRHSRRSRERWLSEGLSGLRPLLIIEDGRIVPLERVRSRGKPVDRLFEFLGEFAHFEQAAVLQGRPSDEAQALFDQVTQAFPQKNLDLRAYGPALAAYLGPDAVGIGVYEGT